MLKYIKASDYAETDEFTLVKEMGHELDALKEFFVDDSKAQKAIAEYFYKDDNAHQADFKELEDVVKTLKTLRSKLSDIVDKTESKEEKSK